MYNFTYQQMESNFWGYFAFSYLFFQFKRLRGESATEETAKLKKDLEKSKEEAREWALKAEMCRLKAEKEAQQQSHRLSEMQHQHETEVQCLNFPWVMPAGGSLEAKHLACSLIDLVENQ